MVATPDPRRLIGRSQYSFHFVACQISDQSLVCSFFRNGKHATDNADAFRIAKSDNVEKGSNRR